MIGDSWAEGIAPYFANGDTASGKQLWFIMNTCVPQNLVFTRYVLYCGLNDIIDPYYSPLPPMRPFVTCLTELCEKFSWSFNKHLYVCTFPKLQYPSGYSRCITAQSLYRLNSAIRTTMNDFTLRYKNIHLIEVPDTYSVNNLDGTGYHLKSYKKLAKYIHTYIDKGDND